MTSIRPTEFSSASSRLRRRHKRLRPNWSVSRITGYVLSRRFAGAAICLLSSVLATEAYAQAAHPLVIYVSGPIGVNSFLKQGWQGAQLAAKELGGTARLFESPDPTTRRHNVEAAAKAGADVVVTITYDFDDILPEIAAAYPAIKFLQVDSCPKDLKPNITCVGFREYEVNFLAGAEAALTTKTGKIGAIGALDIPFIHRWTDSFADGAKYVKPDVQVLPTLWVGGDNPFSDPARGQQRAVSLLSDGADRIMAAASASNKGIFDALPDVPGANAFGVDVNECPTSAGNILDNVEKRTDVAVHTTAVAVVKGTAQQQTSLGLAEGGLDLTGLQPGLAESKCEIVKYPDIIEKVRALKSDIVGGKVVVRDPVAVH
jgi:basic membrane protein A